jgi:hypothetical protein
MSSLGAVTIFKTLLKYQRMCQYRTFEGLEQIVKVATVFRKKKDFFGMRLACESKNRVT